MPAKKVETKSETAKKGTKPVEETKKTTTAKPKTVKKATKKTEKTTQTKQTAKKTTTAKTSKASTETKVKEPIVEKKTVKKKTTTSKTTAKKAPAKKTTATKKVTEKKPAATPVKTKKADKIKEYEQFSLDTCIDMARAMGIDMGYDQYAAMLLEEADEKKIVKSIQDTYKIDSKTASFEEDGYDVDLLPILVSKVADTVDIKASDFISMGEEIQKHLAYEIKEDESANNDEYNADFDLVKKLLMIAQHKGYSTTEPLDKLVKASVKDMVEKFMDVSYVVLKNWQYDDVKFYEGFIYSVLSQFDNIYQADETRAMMDVSDLYIEHGDYGLGDANYAYILRENEIKDQIYYRFAKAYYDIDREKSRAICNDALQYVDDRYTYYPQIMELLEN